MWLRNSIFRWPPSNYLLEKGRSDHNVLTTILFKFWPSTTSRRSVACWLSWLLRVYAGVSGIFLCRPVFLPLRSTGMWDGSCSPAPSIDLPLFKECVLFIKANLSSHWSTLLDFLRIEKLFFTETIRMKIKKTNFYQCFSFGIKFAFCKSILLLF